MPRDSTIRAYMHAYKLTCSCRIASNLSRLQHSPLPFHSSKHSGHASRGSLLLGSLSSNVTNVKTDGWEQGHFSIGPAWYFKPWKPLSWQILLRYLSWMSSIQSEGFFPPDTLHVFVVVYTWFSSGQLFVYTSRRLNIIMKKVTKLITLMKTGTII